MNLDAYFRQQQRLHEKTQTLRQQVEEILAEGDKNAVFSHAGLLRDLVSQLAVSMEELQTFEEELRRQTADRQAAHLALGAEQQRYQELFNLAPDCYLVTNLNGNIQEANQAAADLLGLPYDRVMGKILAVFVPPGERPAFRSTLNQIKAITGVHVWEGRLRPRQGPLLEVEFTAGPARRLDGQVTGLRWLVRDITARKAAEAEQRKASAQLQALAARLQTVREEERKGMARLIHDQLGGDLTALKLDVMWLARHLPPDQAPLLDKTQRMSALIDGVVQVVRRISSDLRPGVLDDLGLVPALEWQLNEFQARTGLDCQIDLDIAEVELDEQISTDVFRLFQEALTNVARHAQATQVEVRLQEAEGVLQLDIQDNGRGIPAEILEHTTNSLGLLGMRERVKLLAGEVAFEAAPGGGTRVAIRVPLNGRTPPENGPNPPRGNSF